jgi:ABC-2 type transport system ATP-binding protein
MFSLRREAEVYQVVDKIKYDLIEQIKISNTLSAKFLAVAPLNQAALETTGVIAVLVLILFAEYVDAPNEHVVFIIMALARMLPSATRILAAVQSYRFAIPVIEKQLAYLHQNPLQEAFETKNQIQVSHSTLTYTFFNDISPKDISFPISTSCLVVVTGESGVGKTTMLEGLVDFLVRKRIEGVDYFTDIRYASQNNLVLEKDVKMNLAFYKEIDEAKLNKGLDLLLNWDIPADHFDTDRLVTNFSGGEKKRVAIARALNCEDGVIILDEPTSGLDVVTSEKVISTIVNKAQENLVIVVSHDQNLIRCANIVFELAKVEK